MSFKGADGFNPHGPDENPDGPARYLDVAVADLIGFRAWHLRTVRHGSDRGRGVLRSLMYTNHIWGPGPHRALPCSTIVGYHPPRRDCSHGYYAYHHTETYEYAYDDERKGVRIEGLIRGWGKCVVGDLGFRSEWAQIVALVVPVDRVFPEAWLERQTSLDDGVSVIEDVTRALEECYPNAPIYSSVEALLDDHPLPGRPA